MPSAITPAPAAASAPIDTQVPAGVSSGSGGSGSLTGGNGSAPASEAAGRPAAWWVEPLQGWHLPLLDDPALVPLQPLAQRALLLALPDRLMRAVLPRHPLVPQVLLAVGRDRSGTTPVFGLIASRRLNRSGSCWQMEHLQISRLATDPRLGPGRRAVSLALLREAILRGRGAASWIATVDASDSALLGVLREQGFQPLRCDALWWWQQPQAQAAAGAAAPLQLPADLRLLPLNRRTAPLLWHLEQAACPALLRQLLDRRVEDLLDQSHGCGWMLVDVSRNQAVAGVRRLEAHPAGGHRIEFSVYPGWEHLLGPATELLLQRMGQTSGEGLWIQSEVDNQGRAAWLEALGAARRGEQVLMARSVWRRQEGQLAQGPRRRIEAMLEQLQPRRQPVPTPAAPR
jgi:hypothetical protein